MANLAIRGHATRGKEVIELLEMLGGINKDKYVGDNVFLYYFINDNYIEWCYEWNPESIFISFTLEEFLEKFPYKVGNDVIAYAEGCLAKFTIQDIRWNWELNKVEYKICSSWIDASLMQLYKEKNMEERKYADLKLDVDQDDKLATEVTIDGNKIIPPENYLIGKITKVDNGMLVEFVKEQPQYPKTYKECCEVLGYEGGATVIGYDAALLNSFQKLKLYRDAYWKITGKEMGLDKPWEPDWLNTEQDKFVIYTHNNVIRCNRYVLGYNMLAFPTEEMRDAFYNNFKDLIEQCKELL